MTNELSSTRKPRRRPAPNAIEASISDVQAFADEVKALVSSGLEIDFVQFPREPEQEGLIVLRGRLRKPSAEVFSDWLTALKEYGCTPVLRPDEPMPHEDLSLLPTLPDVTGAPGDKVLLRVMPFIAKESVQNPLTNLVLFLVTLFSTLFTGAAYSDVQVETFTELFLPQNLIQGWPFALTLMGILTAHEFGHYFAARYHKVAVTLPYFIPLPPPIGIFGTLGAFIRLKEPIADRRKLFDIGVAGPLAGLVLAVPLLFIGLATSDMLVPEQLPGMMLEGNSILYYFAKLWTFGKPLPNAITGEDVMMNQVTFAAWTGLLVTALNLLPLGQLDGGHTVFALFGEAAKRINRLTIGAMAVLAVLGIPALQRQVPGLEQVGFLGWFLWLFLIFFVVGPYHPPALDDVTQLDQRRRWVGYLVILIFVLTFTPVPLRPI